MKKLKFIVVFIAIVFSSCSEEENQNQIPTTGLLAYYSFDGVYSDLSGNNFNGINNQTTFSTNKSGINNTSLLLDGVDDYVITSTEIDNQLGNGFTFSAWIYITKSGVGRILSNYHGQGAAGDCNQRVGFIFGVTEEQQLNVFYALDGNDYMGRKTNISSLSLNSWHQVIATWDGTMNSDGFSLYINGGKSDTLYEESGLMSCVYKESTLALHIGIGACADGLCAPFGGKIDEVRIYNRVLNKDEIAILAKN